MSEWINVKEKMPEKGKTVLACSKYEMNNKTFNDMYVAWIDAYGIKNEPIWIYSWCCGCHPQSPITHWMPLPEDP